jgi:hypothetical protein
MTILPWGENLKEQDFSFVPAFLQAIFGVNKINGFRNSLSHK